MIGVTTVKQFAKYAPKPRVYTIGDNQEVGELMVAEYTKLNPQGSFTSIKHESSLMRNVDEVCSELKKKEKTVNLLHLCELTTVGDKSDRGGFPNFKTITLSPCYLTDRRQPRKKA